MQQLARRTCTGAETLVAAFAAVAVQQARAQALPAAGAYASHAVRMRFRPCIDIHDGAVKQIVGSTLKDAAGTAAAASTAAAPAAAGAAAATAEPVTNFVATQPSSYFAECVCSVYRPGLSTC